MKDSRSTGRLRRRAALLVSLAACLVVLVAAAPALAVNGPFCSGNWLTSGATCHSPYYHTYFDEVEGYSYHNYPTCVGIDVTTSGPNLVNACSSNVEDCLTACTHLDSGYAYVHNHGSIADSYYGVLDAAS